jgi:hypothetical protein
MIFQIVIYSENESGGYKDHIYDFGFVKDSLWCLWLKREEMSSKWGICLNSLKKKKRSNFS